MESGLQSFAMWVETWRVEILLVLALLILVAALVLLVLLLRRVSAGATAELHDRLAAFDQRLQDIHAAVSSESGRLREEAALNARLVREELRASVKDASDSLQKRMVEIAGMQRDQLDSFAKQLVGMTQLNEEKFEAMRRSLDGQLKTLRDENSRKLEQMRETVDEKLQSTLEKRLGESFRQVSDRLEQVYKGLGEMRSLATGVGDLKKVLTNVKTRGTWGEIQLSSILEQILTPDQYDVNVATKKGSSDRVEFAVRLPGQGRNKSKVVWMPIDSKFPQEDYQRLIDAQEAADKGLAEKSIKALATRIKAEAKFIHEKYIDPPHTTDFGIMFLPVEGLYAEVLRQPGLCDYLQRELRIVVTGPTTLAALLNSLQMGFRTLAIERRSSEVWELLGTVKTEFGRFGDVLAKTKKKLQEASTSIDKAEVRTRAIERKLRKVQEIPSSGEKEALPEKSEEQGAV